MKFRIKPKEILINVPVVLLFDNSDQINYFAANINQLIHGKSKLKAEELGCLGGQYVGLFYLNRDSEFTELRQQFVQMIEDEEMNYDNCGNRT